MSEYLSSRPNWSSVDVTAADAAEATPDGPSDGWGTSKYILVGGVVVLLLVAHLGYADGDSSAVETSDEEEGGQDSDSTHDAHSAESAPWETGETSEAGGGLVH